MKKRVVSFTHAAALHSDNAIARANLDGINIPPLDDFTPPSSLFNDRRDTILIRRRAATSSGVFEGFGIIN